MSERDKLCAAVSWIAWGYVLMHFNINIGGLDILPDPVGYLLIYQVLPVLAQREESAGLLRPLALGLTVWNGITWALNIVGITITNPVLNIVVSVAGLYFHFQLLTDLSRCAEDNGCPQSRTLLKLRTVQTVVDTILAVGLYGLDIQAGFVQNVLTALVVVQLAVVIWLCSTLFSLKKALTETEDENGWEQG